MELPFLIWKSISQIRFAQKLLHINKIGMDFSPGENRYLYVSIGVWDMDFSTINANFTNKWPTKC